MANYISFCRMMSRNYYN